MLTSIQGSFILGASEGVLRIGGQIRACNKMGKYEYKSNLELYKFICIITASHQLWPQLDHQKMTMEHMEATCLSLLEATDQNNNVKLIMRKLSWIIPSNQIMWCGWSGPDNRGVRSQRQYCPLEVRVAVCGLVPSGWPVWGQRKVSSGTVSL